MWPTKAETVHGFLVHVLAMFCYSANDTVALTKSFIVFQAVRALMLVVAVFIAAITARPDSAGIVHRVNGLAYGNYSFITKLHS
jgi:hypothetical protein